MTQAIELGNTDQQAPANDGTQNGNTPQSPDHTGIAAPPGSASIAPHTPPAAATDETARLAREDPAKLQSERDTLRSERDTLKATVDDLTAQLEETVNEEELTYRVAHERDEAYLGWLQTALRQGRTLQQVVSRFEADAKSANSQRQSFEQRKQSVEGLLGVIEGFDKPFATFLKQMHATSNAVIDQATIPGLRTLYDTLRAEGKSPAQAAAAATSNTNGKEPPVVAPPGGAAIADAPVWKPGMSASDLFGMALGRLSPNGERPRR